MNQEEGHKNKKFIKLSSQGLNRISRNNRENRKIMIYQIQ